MYRYLTMNEIYSTRKRLALDHIGRGGPYGSSWQEQQRKRVEDDARFTLREIDNYYKEQAKKAEYERKYDEEQRKIYDEEQRKIYKSKYGKTVVVKPKESVKNYSRCCDKCKTSNPDGSNYCGECGYLLDTESINLKAQINKYLRECSGPAFTCSSESDESDKLDSQPFYVFGGG